MIKQACQTFFQAFSDAVKKIFFGRIPYISAKIVAPYSTAKGNVFKNHLLKTQNAVCYCNFQFIKNQEQPSVFHFIS